MTFTNLRKHALVGFAVGFLGAIAALNLLPCPSRRVTLLGALAFFLITLAWELYQYLVLRRRFYASRPPRALFTWRWMDSLADVLVGNIAFLLPWIVITLGTYAGSVLRP